MSLRLRVPLNTNFERPEIWDFFQILWFSNFKFKYLKNCANARKINEPIWNPHINNFHLMVLWSFKYLDGWKNALTSLCTVWSTPKLKKRAFPLNNKKRAFNEQFSFWWVFCLLQKKCYFLSTKAAIIISFCSSVDWFSQSNNVHSQ